MADAGRRRAAGNDVVRAVGTAGGRWLLRPGLALLGLGGAADLGYHLLPRPLATGLEPLFGPGAALAHLATLVGMVAVLLAVVGRGLRPDRPARGPPTPATPDQRSHTTA